MGAGGSFYRALKPEKRRPPSKKKEGDKMNWKLKLRYPYPGPDFWESDKVQHGLDYQGLFAQATVQTRVNGVGTAYATVRYSVESASPKLIWGVDINKHFRGTHAGQQARAWCRYMMENPFSSWQTWD